MNIVTSNQECVNNIAEAVVLANLLALLHSLPSSTYRGALQLARLGLSSSAEQECSWLSSVPSARLQQQSLEMMENSVLCLLFVVLNVWDTSGRCLSHVALHRLTVLGNPGSKHLVQQLMQIHHPFTNYTRTLSWGFGAALC